MEIVGYKCPSCNDFVFSRARHDCRSCTCGAIYVDGGFDYRRIGFRDKVPSPIKVDLNITQQELYDDWNFEKDYFGIIKEG